MQTENELKPKESFWQESDKSHKRGKITGGILIVIIGSLFLGRELGAEIPGWIFSWKTLLIALGLVVGVKCNFRRVKWLIPVFIGGIFLISDLYPELAFRPLLWPILVILVGLAIIFKPQRKDHHFRHNHHFRHRMSRRERRDYDCKNMDFVETSTEDERIDSTTFMGAVKKNVLSKSFKGGSVRSILGGTEINLAQADFEGTAILEITTVLGGTMLIIPAHWEIQSELVSVMGSIEDKRPVERTVTMDKSKTLILKGTVFMGGIDIKSY